MQDFLWTLACADPTLVRGCSERVQSHFTLMGAAVGGIGLVTGLSGYYAAGLLFNQFHTTIIFGLLWGLMFINLYRYMLVNVGFYDDLHKSRDGRSRPWGSVLLRAGLISFFSFVMAQPVELFILRGVIAPRLEKAQTQQRVQVLNGLRSRHRTDSLEAHARLTRLDSAAQMLKIDLQAVQSRQAGYASATDWRLDAARRAAQGQEQELRAQLAQLASDQAPEREALAQAEAARQANVQAEIDRFDYQQRDAGTLLLQIQILHRELRWAGVLTVLIMFGFLLPLLQRTFLQGQLSEFVRSNTWEETQVIKAAYSQFKIEYAATFYQVTGQDINWPDNHADPRDWEKEGEELDEAFQRGKAGVETGRLADIIRAHATTSTLPAA